MRTIERSSAFKRDYKREAKGQHQHTLDESLSRVLLALAKDQQLEPRYQDHDLSGNVSGYRECYVKPDLLLIYRKSPDELLRLARLGSHSELFGWQVRSRRRCSFFVGLQFILGLFLLSRIFYHILPFDTKTLNGVIKALPANRRRKAEKRAAALIAGEMTLQDLRHARAMTQVSEIEKRTGMHISTLRRSIEAIGGKLPVIAEFPDRVPVMLAGIAAIGHTIFARNRWAWDQERAPRLSYQRACCESITPAHDHALR